MFIFCRGHELSHSRQTEGSVPTLLTSLQSQALPHPTAAVTHAPRHKTVQCSTARSELAPCIIERLTGISSQGTVQEAILFPSCPHNQYASASNDFPPERHAASKNAVHVHRVSSTPPTSANGLLSHAKLAFSHPKNYPYAFQASPSLPYDDRPSNYIPLPHIPSPCPTLQPTKERRAAWHIYRERPYAFLTQKPYRCPSPSASARMSSSSKDRSTRR